MAKYNGSGEVQWAKGLGGTGAEIVYALGATSEGGCVVGGYFSSTSIDFGNGVSLTNKSGEDGWIAKYSSNGQVEWAKGTGNSSVRSINGTSDGGCVVGGYFYEVSLDNGVRLASKGNYDGMILKYSNSGKIESVLGVGGAYYD